MALVSGIDLPRLPDWRPRLEAALARHRGASLDYGRHDCGILVADAVEALVGLDYAKAFRGKYKGHRAAKRLLKSFGAADMPELVASLFRGREVHQSQGAEGDLAAVPTDDEFGMAMGVIIGERIAVYGPNGFGHIPLIGGPNEIRRVFKVG